MDKDVVRIQEHNLRTVSEHEVEVALARIGPVGCQVWITLGCWMSRGSEFSEHRADLANALPLSKTHQAAFDREPFTIDQDYRLRMNPSFETQSEVVQ